MVARPKRRSTAKEGGDSSASNRERGGMVQTSLAAFFIGKEAAETASNKPQVTAKQLNKGKSYAYDGTADSMEGGKAPNSTKLPGQARPRRGATARQSGSKAAAGLRGGGDACESVRPPVDRLKVEPSGGSKQESPPMKRARVSGDSTIHTPLRAEKDAAATEVKVEQLPLLKSALAAVTVKTEPAAPFAGHLTRQSPADEHGQLSSDTLMRGRSYLRSSGDTIDQEEVRCGGIPIQEATDDDEDGPLGIGEGQEEGPDDNAFEREREERIQRNQMLLAKLGLQGGLGLSQPEPSTHKRPKQKKPVRQPLQDATNASVRRSTRSRGTPQLDTSTEAADTTAPSAPEPSETLITYDDSSVFRYICDEDGSPGTACPSAAQAPSRPPGATLKGFIVGGRSLCDGSLTRAYGLDVGSGLIAAGGHQGRVAVWGLKGLEEAGSDEDIQPLLSCKLHRGWICDVQLVKGAHSEMPLLLTASNDSSVSLWDLSKCGGPLSLPKKLMETDTIHSSGIFSMECLGVTVLTASKDSTTAISRIRTEGATLHVERVINAHEGVVKFATWRDNHTFASGGNDSSILIHDLRAEQSTAMEIPQAHSSSVNYGKWSPVDANLILSSGFDDALKVFDIRRPQSALHAFRGHSRTSKSIYQPQWVDEGRGIATGGDTGLLSLYCLKMGMARSRGDIGFEPKATLVYSTGSGEETLFLATTKAVVAYAPKWQ